jgi:hypothetical protein
MKWPHCLGFMVIDTCLNMDDDRNKKCGFMNGVASIVEKYLPHTHWKIAHHNIKDFILDENGRQVPALSVDRKEQ